MRVSLGVRLIPSFFWERSSSKSLSFCSLGQSRHFFSKWRKPFSLCGGYGQTGSSLDCLGSGVEI